MKIQRIGEGGKIMKKTGKDEVEKRDKQSKMGLTTNNLSPEEIKINLLGELYNRLLIGYGSDVEKKLVELLNYGIEPDDIFRTCILEAGRQAVNLRQEGTYFVPEMRLTANSIKKCMNILMPLSTKAATRGSKSFIFINYDGWPAVLDPVLLGAGFEVMTILECFAFLFNQYQFSNIEGAIGYLRNNPESLILLVGYELSVKETVSTLEKENLRQRIKIAVPQTYLYLRDDYVLSLGADISIPMNARAENIVLKLLEIES